MEWQQLKYFQCVAETEHIGCASALLHVTQPAISMSIKKLEEELGVPLFDRSRKGICLNKFGRAYLMHVTAAMKELEAGQKEILEMMKTDANRVTVMMPANFMSPRLMDAMYAETPNIVIENLSIDFSTSRRGLMDGTLDLCVLSPPETGPDIESITLERQKMCVLTSSCHPFVDREEMYLREFANEKFVAYSENTAPRINFEEHCRNAGFTPVITYECNSIRSMLNPVLAGRGVCLTSVGALSTYDMSGLHVIRLRDEGLYTELALSYRKGLEQRPLAAKLRDVILLQFSSGSGSS